MLRFPLIYLVCGCNEQGSINMSCDSTGKCTCKDDIIGNKCTNCTNGRFPFPNCNKGEKFYK